MTEDKYLEHIKDLKELYDEVLSLIRSGYDGPFMGEEVRGVISACMKAERSKNGLHENREK
jgi:hypothetical protein